MSRLFKHPFLLTFALALVVLGYFVTSKAIQQDAATAETRRGRPQGAMVSVGLVTRQDMADQVESLGTALANESIEITAKVADTVNKLHFEDGDYVKAGQLLVELTNRTEATRLAEAQVNANDAQRQFARVQELAERKMMSSKDLDTARTTMEAANARLDGVMVAMNDKVIRAPFAGLLGFRKVSNGSLVSPGAGIATLDDISIIKLDYTIPEVYLANVHSGLMIKARSVVYPDREFDGEIKAVGTRVDPVTRSVTVRAHINNKDSVLRPGMLLTVMMKLNVQQALVVPEQAVIVNGERQFVFVVDEQSVAHQTRVTLGRRSPGVVEVLSGLQEGQRIVTMGASQVRPNQPVQAAGEAGEQKPKGEGRRGKEGGAERGAGGEGPRGPRDGSKQSSMR